MHPLLHFRPESSIFAIMDSFIDSLPDLTQTQIWIVAAVLALLLFLISRIVAKRKEKKNLLLGLLTIILSTALVIFVLVGIRGLMNPVEEEEVSPVGIEGVEVVPSGEIIPPGDGEIPSTWVEVE